MIIFQHFNNTFSDIAKLVVPNNKEYGEKYNHEYKDYYGSFHDYYPSQVSGKYKEYWTKLVILSNLLESSTQEWILMLDGDILLNQQNDIGILTQAMSKDKHIGLCRATDNIDEAWNINIGSMFVRKSEISNIIIQGLLMMGEEVDFNEYEQPALQYTLRKEDRVKYFVEVFPPLTFNGTNGPFLFHPCGKGFTSTDKDKENAISNKILALKQKLSGSL